MINPDFYENETKRSFINFLIELNNLHMLRNFLLWFIILFIPLIISENAIAQQGRGRLWLGLYSQKNFREEKNWLWSFNSQARFTKQTHPFESIFVEPLFGYQMNNNNTIWLGCRFTRHVYNKPSFTDNRLVQQIVSSSKLNNNSWSFRWRLEEHWRSDQKQLNLRFRQRTAIEFPEFSSNHNMKPFIFNELFFMLNKTNYTSHQFISENRLFLGVNYYIQKSAWWEIGYMLQYLARRPQNRNYQLHHVLTINFNFR